MKKGLKLRTWADLDAKETIYSNFLFAIFLKNSPKLGFFVPINTLINSLPTARTRRRVPIHSIAVSVNCVLLFLWFTYGFKRKLLFANRCNIQIFLNSTHCFWYTIRFHQPSLREFDVVVAASLIGLSNGACFS